MRHFKLYIPAEPTRADSRAVARLQESIAVWMQENEVEHWKSYRQNYSYWAVEFFGLDAEQEATAFKLKFETYNTRDLTGQI